MQFVSQNVRDSLTRTGDPTLTALRQNTKKRYQQTLRFMEEWTNDLLQRENQLQQQRNELSLSSVKLESSKSKLPSPSPTLNIQNLIKGEFLKRVQSLYMKQLVLADLSEGQRSQTSQTSSLNQSMKSSNTFAEGHCMLDQSGEEDFEDP